MLYGRKSSRLLALRFMVALSLVILSVAGSVSMVWAANIQFARQTDIELEGTGIPMAGTAFADLNNDGQEDLIVIKYGDNDPETDPYLSINLRNEDGSYQSQILYDAGYWTDLHNKICVEDLNNDGKLDIAITVHNDYATPKGRIDYFLGNGNGTFGARQNRTTSDYPEDILAGDFNKDGHMDLALCRYASTNVVAVHYGLVDGGGLFTGFSEAYNFLSSTGTYSRDLVAGDFNNDTWLDLAVNNLNSNVYVLLNSQSSGYASFPSATSLPISATYAFAPGGEIVCADFNTDGNQDLAIAGSAIYVKMGNGDGTFADSVQYGPAINPSYPTGSCFESLVTDDFNLDGHLDLITLSRYDIAWSTTHNDIYFFHGLGNGTFDNMLSFELASGVDATPGCMKIANFNNDGKSDLAVHITTNNRLIRLFNNLATTDPAPTVTSVSPTSGTTANAACSVTITGTGFVSGAAVELNNNGATPISGTSVTVVSPTEITCSFDLTGVTTNLNNYWDVKVTNLDFQSGTGSNLFTIYRPNPTVSSITPNTGANTGPMNVTVTGTNFVAGLTTVKLYNSPETPITATNIVVNTSTQLTCTLDLTGQPIGTWNVGVSVTGAEMTAMLWGGFTITAPAPAPTVTAIDPASGTTAGGTPVTITGTNFVDGCTVAIGGQAATSVNFTDATTLTASTPAHAAGTVDVVVTNPDTQYGTLGNGFTFVEPSGTAPAITMQPEDQTQTAGEGVSFSAAASGDPAPAVQWQVSTNGGKRWQNLAGETTSTLTLATVSAKQNGYQYRAVFTNTLGSATTNPALLTVTSGAADLAITQTGGFDSATKTITWTITLVNNGPDIAQGVVIKDTLVNGTKVAGVSTAFPYKLKGRTIIVDVGQLAVGEATNIVIIEALVTRATSPVSNTVTVESTSLDLDLSNNSHQASVDIA